MINTVWVINQNGRHLELNLRGSDNDVGLLIYNLTGLGSPKATVNGVGGPGFDGIRVNSVRTDSRHMVLTLAVPGVGTAEEVAKDLIYEFFPVKQQITIGFKTDSKEVYTKAYVENNEFNQFAKVENAVISLLSPNPYFIDVAEQELIIDYYSAIPMFEFPFFDDFATTPSLIFGERISSTGVIAYTGGVETGIDINLYFSGYVSDITIANSNGQQAMTLDLNGAENFFNGAVENGDYVVINTRVGEKSAHFIRNGVWFDIINGIGIEDDWVELRPGTNTIVISATQGESLVEADIRYNQLREGI